MTEGSEVTIAGQQYRNVAAHIQAVLGTLRSITTSGASGPIEVTVEPDAELDPAEIRSLV